MSVLGPWILQSFLGKETTFGDDRHLTNRILSLGNWTGYLHLAKCESDTPAGFVRWVKQQTRWSKSFFREALFPKSFAYAQFWLTVETTKQFMYPVYRLEAGLPPEGLDLPPSLVGDHVWRRPHQEHLRRHLYARSDVLLVQYIWVHGKLVRTLYHFPRSPPGSSTSLVFCRRKYSRA